MDTDNSTFSQIMQEDFQINYNFSDTFIVI